MLLVANRHCRGYMAFVERREVESTGLEFAETVDYEGYMLAFASH